MTAYTQDTIQHNPKFTDWHKQPSLDPALSVIAWRMIELALLDLRRKTDKYNYRTAYAWVFGDQDFFYSFEHMYDVTGLNAADLRRRVRRCIGEDGRLRKVKEIK